ncbi:MAG: glycosyltransferase family 9 protein [Elusimicrobia bacterium]|nr:glycosyltransferase family 9 protein [Elusimicrobiota bacterium]
MTAPKKILVVALDNLGDTVMATAILRPVRRLFPAASVGMFVKSYAADLLADHSLVDRVHAADPFWDVSPGRAAGSFGAFWSTLRQIRRERYDTAILLNTEWRRALAAAVARIPSRVGYDRRNARRFLTSAVAETQPAPHFIEAHRRLVAELAGGRSAAEGFVPRLEFSSREMGWWERWSAGARVEKGNYVVIHPYSGDQRKNWPVPAWAELVERLRQRDRGARVVFICSGAEKAGLTSALDHEGLTGAEVVAGAPLRHIKAVISQARLLIGGDSGPGHIAAALGVPVLSLFGPGRPERSGPRGHAPVKFLQAEPLSTLDVDTVTRAAFEMMDGAVKEDA